MKKVNPQAENIARWQSTCLAQATSWVPSRVAPRASRKTKQRNQINSCLTKRVSHYTTSHCLPSLSRQRRRPSLNWESIRFTEAWKQCLILPKCDTFLECDTLYGCPSHGLECSRLNRTQRFQQGWREKVVPLLWAYRENLRLNLFKQKVEWRSFLFFQAVCYACPNCPLL